jgi:hypothetical protein
VLGIAFGAFDLAGVAPLEIGRASKPKPFRAAGGIIALERRAHGARQRVEAVVGAVEFIELAPRIGRVCRI